MVRARARWQPLSSREWLHHPLSVWRWMKQMTARGQGQPRSLITLPHLKPPEKVCHPVHCRSHRTRSRHSSWVKRTECSLCDSKACGHWADASSLVTGCSNPLPRCFFLTGPWEEENGRARGAESLSGKKAILEGREARLKLSQWEQSATLSTASAWDFPKHDTHSAWVSSACRGDLHVYNDGAAFATTPFEICSFRGSVDRRRMAAGMTESVSWALREVQSGCWGISTADPGVSEESAKKEVCRWREEIGVAVATAIDWLIFLS